MDRAAGRGPLSGPLWYLLMGALVGAVGGRFGLVSWPMVVALAAVVVASLVLRRLDSARLLADSERSGHRDDDSAG